MERPNGDPYAGQGYPTADGGVAIFKNKRLETLSKTHPYLLLAVWVPISVGCFAWAFRDGISLYHALMLMVLAPLVWSLIEYGLHRWIFHLPVRGPFSARLGFVLHGSHHVQPNNLYRNVSPLTMSLPIGAAIYVIARLTMDRASANFGFGVFGLAYAAYECLHWRFHQRAPLNAIEGALRRHHLAHHYSPYPGNYGVSTPLWDVVFGSGVTKRVSRARCD